MPQMLSVEKSSSTLREHVVARVRDAIVTGILPPGARLIERQISERLGVSRPLLREALRHLQAEGWVEAAPAGGLSVATVAAAAVRDLYQVRGALEGLAVALCAANASPSQLEAMEQAIEALAAAERRGDRDAQREHAGTFYELVHEATGNRLLQRQLAMLRARASWMRTLAFSRPARARANVAEEIALMAALKARDADLACRLCQTHLRLAADAMIAALPP